MSVRELLEELDSLERDVLGARSSDYRDGSLSMINEFRELIDAHLDPEA